MIGGREVFPFYTRRLSATEDTAGHREIIMPCGDLRALRWLFVHRKTAVFTNLIGPKQEAVVKAPADRR
jgi:hypothetical protein